MVMVMDAFGNVIDDGASVLGLVYTHDDLSRPIARNDDIFAYNGRGEVAFAEIAGNVEEHAYDLSGNSIWASFNSVTNHYTANNLNQYSSISTLRDSVSPCETIPHYDADGNMTDCGPWSYTYDAASQLVSVSSNGILLVTNFYDARGRRVKKVTQSGTFTFFYDGWNLVEEHVAYTNGTTSTIHYYWGKDLSDVLQGAGGVGGMLYLTINGTIYIPCYDNNGNITRYLDANGSTVASYTYDAFGRTISQSGPLADVFRHRFSTKYLDSETGLYYYGYRFYFLRFSRWMTRDPSLEEGGLNLYSMLSNNTANQYDYLGLVPDKKKTGEWQLLNRTGSIVEMHVYNCVEFEGRGTHDKYIKHFLDVTFKSLPENYRYLFSYGIVNQLGMGGDSKVCWCLTLAPCDVYVRKYGTLQYKVVFRVTTLDKHPCCNAKEIHVSEFEGKTFTLGPI